jgi:hypothetical protein
MLTHPTSERLRALGLVAMAQALEEQRRQPDLDGLGFEERRKRQPVPAGDAVGLKFQGRRSSRRSMVWPRARRSRTAVM